MRSLKDESRYHSDKEMGISRFIWFMDYIYILAKFLFHYFIAFKICLPLQYAQIAWERVNKGKITLVY